MKVVGTIWAVIILVVFVGSWVLLGPPFEAKSRQTTSCISTDRVTSMRDEYTGAWAGTVRHVYWLSGAKTIEDEDDKSLYVGKSVCREWSN